MINTLAYPRYSLLVPPGRASPVGLSIPLVHIVSAQAPRFATACVETSLSPALLLPSTERTRKSPTTERIAGSPGELRLTTPAQKTAHS